MQDKKVYLGRYILAFTIATILFVLVFLISYSVSYLNYKTVSNENSLIINYTKDLENLLNDKTCSDNLLVESSEKMDAIVTRLGILETRFGKHDFRVLEQKKLFSELSYNHFQIVRRLIKECDADITTLIFFYSNEKSYEKESVRTGIILSTLKNVRKSRTMIYSYDFDLDSDLISKIKMQYNITEAPIVVVNEKIVTKISNIDELEKYLE